MREDETVAQAMGINTFFYKLLAFATGAAFAGLGGALFASRNQYTGPEDHSLMVSINVLCLVIVGGMGSIPGVIVGAFVLKGLPEVLRDLESYRLLAFGALLVVMMIWRPEGLWPAPRRRLEFHEDKLNETIAIEERGTGMNILETYNLTKRFGGLVAVNQVSIQVPEGSIISIIGPNGAGKTTFFNCVTGFYAPDEGQYGF